MRNQLLDISEKINRLFTKIETEEATKQAFVLPFLMALGYDIYDPTEVIPEFNADFGTKKGEKVDYAVCINHEPSIIVECKKISESLEDHHISQLYRYFSVTKARVALLTNGVDYRFFSDIDQANVMDTKPFLEFSIHNVNDDIISSLQKMCKDSFDISDVVSSASTMKFRSKVKDVISKELLTPTDTFTRSIISQFYEGRITASILSKAQEIVKDSFAQIIESKVESKIKLMLTASKSQDDVIDHPSVIDITKYMSAKQQDSESIETTDIEVEGFLLVLSLIKDFVSEDRVVWRDVSTYFGVLFDDNNRKPICRLHFNSAQKYISLFDGDDRAEEKIAISQISDITNYRARIVKTLLRYLDEA